MSCRNAATVPKYFFSHKDRVMFIVTGRRRSIVENKNEQPAKRAFYREAVSLGFTMAGGMVLFVCLGGWIGRKAGHPKAGLLTGIFLGLIHGGYETYRLVRQLGGWGNAKK